MFRATRANIFFPPLAKIQCTPLLVLIDKGNLVHSAIVSGEFREAIGGKISSSIKVKVKDYKF